LRTARLPAHSKLRARHSTRRVLAAASASVLLLSGAAACSRSGGSSTPDNTNSSAAAPTSSTGDSASPGDFGTLKKICGPGNATGGSGRGISGDTITLGTMSDAGSTIVPGLEIEFFQVADAFVKWCNEAGGINGRKLKVNKHDAKLFESGARTIDACQTDFMMVGNGDAFDQATVKPRLNCKLGQIPAYVVSPDAYKAGLQVLPSPGPINEYPVGAFRRLAEMFPEAKAHFGIGSSNNASIRPVGLRLRDALQQIGYKVVELQEQPPLVDNWRPYASAAKQKGVQAWQQISAQDLTPLVTAANNVGWKPTYFIENAQFYDPKTIKAAKSTNFPTTYIYLNHWPFELADQNSTVAQEIKILHDSDPNAATTDFTALAFSAWALWAKSATECGANLTQDCVLQKAAANHDWSSGGMYPAHDVDPANAHTSPCITMLKVTPNGFVYDKDATKPNQDIFNCGPDNVVKLANTYQ
jgi:ABC-type branched-subunit amino acid transport system substrate-binding protein